MCRKRGKAERESDTRISQEVNEGVNGDESKNKLPGLLEIDTGLWDHIQQVLNTIKPLPSTTQQVQELAKYMK